MPQAELLELLTGVGEGLGMDCSVVPSKKYKDMLVVSTTDFFYPLVEDPYEQGRIACANVLSDMYALGVHEVDNLLMLLAASSDMEPGDRKIVTRLMIKGFDDQAKAAGTSVTGGQTVFNPWPIIGGVAKSICMAKDVIMPINAVAGDVLVLTKPIGTQVAVFVKSWMLNEAKWSTVEPHISRDDGMRAYNQCYRQMGRLNRNGALLMHKYGAHAATDVTGFGITGHAANLCSNQLADVSFVIHTLPVIRGMAVVARAFPFFKLFAGTSPETSGGLLVCLPRDSAEAYCRELKEIDGHDAWIIGDVVEGGGRTASIVEDLKVIDV